MIGSDHAEFAIRLSAAVVLEMLNRGDQIGSYVVKRRLGAGGMGEVYLAQHRHIDRRAAIKVLLPELSANEEVVARFFTEARAASRIKHPAIVEIVDCEIDPRRGAFIVMEFLDGESLAATLERDGSLDLNSALAVTGQIASALAAAHATGIVHRDLKPDNVFLKSTPGAETALSVKILDFGIAKLIAGSPGDKRKTHTGSLLGTPLYMAPEQCRGAGRIDHRADVYSLGCMAFEMITGRPPFVREGAGELIAAHLSEPAPEILTMEPSLPPDLAGLVMSMLAKDPGTRPQSMNDVVQSIERLLGVPSTQFLRILQTPEGFPAAQEISQDVPLASEASSGVLSSPGIAPMAGHTRVLPEDSQQQSVKATTLGQTASELTGPRILNHRKRRTAWIVVLFGLSGLVGIAVLVARRPIPAPSRPVAPVPEEVVPRAGVESPSPSGQAQTAAPPGEEAAPEKKPSPIGAQARVKETPRKPDSPGTETEKRPQRKKKRVVPPSGKQDPYSIIHEQ